MVGVMGEELLDGETIIGIPDLDALDPALRQAGTEAWKLRAATRDAHSILSRCDSEKEQEHLAGDVYTALTETIPAFMETFVDLYEVGMLQFQYLATGMHDSLDNPDRVAQQALRRYHLETARTLERVDALAERYLDMSLREHAPRDGYTERFRLEADDGPTVVDGWADERDRYMNAYGSDEDGDDWDEDRYGSFGASSF